ncbi:hypothetical protein IMW82_13140 [Rhodanobacter sp. B2A1Ga4]|uniref:hypothetical protein n=1 Tax=Rhodanobacter sp. B2A1Ga4 TaxID=2778647 RepID=UPI001B39CB6F|nr:hypothetical protein [Rhodanobacter sp. B2A1Ga4]MBQ4855616.1 hypothetical protein [Rhodanobacter sp. B2A1Ga4]
MSKNSADNNDGDRRNRIMELEQSLQPWMTGKDTEQVVADLVTFQLALLARRFPAKLKAGDKKKIKDNFPDASDALIAERSMSKEGLAWVLALATQMAEIAIDYSPLSHCKPSIDNDEKHQAVIRDVLEPQVSAAFEASVEAGLSPYGATTMLIILGVINGIRHGVHWSAVARPLVESVTVALKKGGSVELSPEQEELALQALMGQMGISRSEAKKYAELAKKRILEGG